jgi:hypothetical protein
VVEVLVDAWNAKRRFLERHPDIFLAIKQR